jgi:hypothetical protein
MRLRVPVVAMAVAVVVASVICQFRIGFNNDNGWLLYAAERVARGDRLYVDLLEINPPLIVWLNLPIVWLAHVLGAEAVTVFRGSVLLAILGSACITDRLLRDAFPDLGRWAPLGLGLLVLLAIPVTWFGQREHLLLILALPYLSLSAGRINASTPALNPAAAGVGVLAGLGFALKPQFLGIVLLLTWLQARRRRLWITPELLAIVAVGLVYLVAVVILVPEYVPLVRRLGAAYGRYRTESLPRMLLGHFEPLIALAATGVVLVYRRAVRAAALISVMTAALLGALAGVVLQGKGFDYHYYPALALALLTLGLLASGALAPGPPGRRARFVSVGFLVTGSLAYVAADVRIALASSEPEMQAYRRLAEAVGSVHGRPILVLAPRSGFAFGLVTYGHARWAGRFPCLWLQPVLYQEARPAAAWPHAEAEMSGLERWARDVVIEDAVRERPALLLIGVPTPGQGPPDYWFDYLAYFSRDPRFREFLAGYERDGSSVGYEIYRRRADLAGMPQRASRASEVSGAVRSPGSDDRSSTAVESQNQMPQSSRASW